MKLDRRRFLFGMGSSVLVLPALASLGTRVEAQVAAPKRLILMFNKQGAPATSSLFWPAVGPLAASGISRALEPLGAIRDKTIVVSGIGNPYRFMRSFSDDHVATMLTVLTCQNRVGSGDGEAGGPSFEQALGPRLRGSALRSSIYVSASIDYQGDHPHFYAPAGAQFQEVGFLDPSPHETARTLFATLPGTTPPPAPTLRQRLVARRTSVLDAVHKELTALANRVSADDKLRLDSHATHIRTLEQRFNQPPPAPTAQCQRPDHAGVPTDFSSTGSGRNDNITAPAQIENIVMALACDVTRVAVLDFPVGHDPRFPWQYGGDMSAARGSYASWHDQVHLGGNDAAAQNRYADGNRFYAEMFTQLVTRLSQVDDVDGRKLIDNTVVLWMSEFGTGEDHDALHLPVVMAGMTGAFTPGRHVRLPVTRGNNGSCHTTGDLFAQIARWTTGASDATFGATGQLPSSAYDYRGDFGPGFPLSKGPLPI